MPEPGLRPSTGASSVPWAPPTSTRPEADHFRSPRLVAATHHLCGSHTLPQRPCLRMLTPLPRLERTGSSVGCSPTPRRPSPYGRRVGSSEKLSRPAQGSRAFRPAHLHLGCTEDFPGGFSRTIARARLLQWLPGEPTIPRAGLPPAGLRDPGGLSVICKSAHIRPPFVSHCHAFAIGASATSALSAVARRNQPHVDEDAKVS